MPFRELSVPAAELGRRCLEQGAQGAVCQGISEFSAWAAVPAPTKVHLAALYNNAHLATRLRRAIDPSSAVVASAGTEKGCVLAREADLAEAAAWRSFGMNDAAMWWERRAQARSAGECNDDRAGRDHVCDCLGAYLPVVPNTRDGNIHRDGDLLSELGLLNTDTAHPWRCPSTCTAALVPNVSVHARLKYEFARFETAGAGSTLRMVADCLRAEPIDGYVIMVKWGTWSQGRSRGLSKGALSCLADAAPTAWPQADSVGVRVNSQGAGRWSSPMANEPDPPSTGSCPP